MSVPAAVHDPCRESSRLLGAFLDGQLDAVRMLEVEEHIAECEACRERLELDRAVRGSLKKVARVVSPEGLRARAAKAMLAERARGEAREAPYRGGGETEVSTAKLFGWRTMLPLTSAAALALVWSAVAQTGPQRSATTDVMRAGFVDDPLADLVAEHSRPLPPERTDPKDVRAFERYVGVPVHPPMFDQKTGARLVGGRVLAVHHERAAMLQYEIGHGQGTQRVSVFIYDPRKIQVGGPNLAPRAVGTAEILVGRADGYSVAVTQRQGVGYAVASDMDAEHSAELAAFTDSE